MNRKTNIWYNLALGAAIALCVLFIFALVNWNRSQKTSADLSDAIRRADLATREVEH